MYFSRSPIPYPRDDLQVVEEKEFPAYRHLGVYAYSAEFLRVFRELSPGDLEKIERLEQLRAMENGRRIAVVLTEDHSFGVDSPEDLERVTPLLETSTQNGG